MENALPAGLGALGGFLAYAVARIFLNNKYPTKEMCVLKHTNLENDLAEIKDCLKSLSQKISEYHDDRTEMLFRLEKIIDRLSLKKGE